MLKVIGTVPRRRKNAPATLIYNKDKMPSPALNDDRGKRVLKQTFSAHLVAPQSGANIHVAISHKFVDEHLKQKHRSLGSSRSRFHAIVLSVRHMTETHTRGV
ncbi:hypothetical protein EVAR_24894_1 [Eumeta japonica]|uniref:Uncharacterized protein n=1 Tax=Eumeta variegata TaxID=151549 RepID=A0A4C1V654_EUMVA|nr:hypothetical protein EVAR_24894_1 [Eumeta japonica]